MLDDRASVLLASVDITPADLGSVRTAGYSDQLPPPHGVDQPLEANVLGLSGGALSSPLYVVAVDVLYGGLLGSELAALLGCAGEQVVVLASHTHFAPATDPGLPRLGRVSHAWVRDAAARIAEAVADAPWREGVRVRCGTAEVPHHLFVNRRRPILGMGLRLGGLGTVVGAPEPSGHVDRTVRLLELVDDDDEVIAVGWGASCHPVCAPDRHAIASDFPGAVRALLRGSGSDLPVLFFQGCSGDVRPASMSRRPPASARGLLRYLLAGMRTFEPQSQTEFDSWCGALADTVDAARRASGDLVEVRPRLRRVTGGTPGEWARSPELGLVAIAEEIALLAVNAEVVSTRNADLPPVGTSSIVIPATCADDVLGYWPTSQILREGGYEGRRSWPFFPAVGWERDDPDELWRTMLAAVLAPADDTSGRGGPAR